MSKDKRPNIIQIITDQQCAFTMSCTGNSYINTPNMDKLAEKGVRFEKAYVANPLCVCSRAGMLTGLMPSQTVLPDPAGFPREWYPEELKKHSTGWLMKDSGYDVAYAGKWHAMWMGGPKEHGYRSLMPDNLGAPTNYYYGREPETVSASINYIKEEHKNPYYLTVSLIQPHGICFWGANPGAWPHKNIEGWAEGKDPWDMEDADGLPYPHPPLDMNPKEFIEKCCPPLPDNYEISNNEPEVITDRFREGYNFKGLKMSFEGKGTYSKDWTTEDIWRVRQWTYYRLVEYVDWNLGHIFDALKESGEYDNTIIVFTSDHGDMCGSHKLRLKQCLYEENIRVPLIISGPGIQSNVVDNTHIMDNCIDWLSTLCDYAGITPPKTTAGESWKGILEGKDVNWRTEHVVESNEGLMLRYEKYKYTSYAQSPKNPEQLFDYESDPGEMINLAKSPDFTDIMKKCRKSLATWQANHKPLKLNSSKMSFE